MNHPDKMQRPAQEARPCSVCKGEKTVVNKDGKREFCKACKGTGIAQVGGYQTK